MQSSQNWSSRVKRKYLPTLSLPSPLLQKRQRWSNPLKRNRPPNLRLISSLSQDRMPCASVDWSLVVSKFPEQLKAMDALQSALRFRFKDIRWLYEACTHRSAKYSFGSTSSSLKHCVDFERLECIGDSVVGLSISDILSRGNGRFGQHELTTFRARFVSSAGLAAVSSEFEVFKCILLGSQEKVLRLQDTDKLRGDHLEAVIGAMFCDQGYDQTLPVIQTLFTAPVEKFFSDVKEYEPIVDIKNQLQEITQSRYRETPKYITTDRSGPDHAPQFTVAVLVRNKQIAEGSGISKKLASEKAAENAMEKYNSDAKTFFQRIDENRY